MRRAREILEPVVQAVSEQAAAANGFVKEALEAGVGGSLIPYLHEMLRLELLNAKADLEALPSSAR
jgi:hypothetical protein